MARLFTRRQCLGALAPLAGCGRRAGNTVNWGSWQGHVEPSLLSEFQKLHGTSVNPIGISDNAENLIRTMLGGPRTFDVIQADGLWCRKYYQAGLIEPIDLDEIPNAKKNLYDQFRTVPGMVENGKLLQLNWGWSPWILAYNKKKVDPPPTSWKALWDPKYQGRVLMYSGTRPLMIAALVLGYPPWDMNDGQLAKVVSLLLEVKRNLLKFNIDTLEVQSLLRSESVWLAMEASPGRVTRITRDGGPEIGWIIPAEGTYAWVDGDLLVKGAPNRDAALQLLNFIHRPEYATQNMRRIPRGCCNRAAVELLLQQGEKALVEENLMNRPELFARMEIDRAPADLEAYATAWNEVAAG